MVVMQLLMAWVCVGTQRVSVGRNVHPAMAMQQWLWMESGERLQMA